jgi:hypothetical protein
MCEDEEDVYVKNGRPTGVYQNIQYFLHIMESSFFLGKRCGQTPTTRSAFL